MCSWLTIPHSAHSATPYAAFSTLQPTTTRPSSTKPATPTGKLEYGAYARCIACTAAARRAGQSTATPCASPTSAAFSAPVRQAVGGRHPQPLRGQAEHQQRGDVRRHAGEVVRDGL